MTSFSWVLFLGGLTFFFFGLAYARQALQSLAGDKMRLAIAHMTGNRFAAVGFGALITTILQSSTATILMLMSLASTGLLSLAQAFGVILGADIGTTLVVLLISVKKITHYALLLVVLGFLVEWIFKNSKRTYYFGKILFGFGLVFYGMKLMTETAVPLGMDPRYLALLELFANSPVALLIAATVLTVVIQTSAAVIGIAIALGLSGALSLTEAIPIVLGANVGTCFTTLLASLTSDPNGKRVALAHLFVKAAGVSLAILFVPEIAAGMGAFSTRLLAWTSFVRPGVGGEIALFHLFFNVALAILFLPFLPVGVWAVSKMIPAPKGVKKFAPKYLDPKALETPALALAQAKQEILRIAGLAKDLYRDALKIFEGGRETCERWLVQTEERDDKIDLLEREVRFYLAKIAKEAVTERQFEQEVALLALGDDLEGIGDIISKELGRLARKKIETGRVFSKEGWEEIQKIHQSGLDIFEMTAAAIAAPSEALALKVRHAGEHYLELQQSLRLAHIGRLHAGRLESVETSSIHLDVLGNLRQINDHLVHLSQTALKS